jgi:hypothetical protein
MLHHKKRDQKKVQKDHFTPEATSTQQAQATFA